MTMMLFPFISPGEISPSGHGWKHCPTCKANMAAFPKSNGRFHATFNIGGIPAYVVVDKEGKTMLREDFPNVNLIKKVLIQESKK